MSARYSDLNLRWNPFSEPLPSERPGLVVGDISGLVEILGRGRVCLQLLGRHGRGKTSRLLALHAALGAPYVRLRDSREIPQAPLVLLDEGELLWRRRWWRLWRCGAVAISTHRDLGWGMRRLGFSVTTRVVRGLKTPDLVEMVSRRLDWARKGPGPVPQVPERTLRILQGQYGDDVRAIEGALYERFAALDDIVEVAP